MNTLYSAKLVSIIEEFNLEIIYAPEEYEKIVIVADDVNRPGLQLAGFFDYFDSSRLQMLGKVETTYVDQFSPEKRREVFEQLFSKHIPAVIVSRGLDPYPECLEMAEKYGVPLLRSIDPTSYLISALIAYLKVALAPRITRHGVLVEVYGEGVLLLGESGVGKSETAIELVKRGHRLIADDAVELKKVSSKTIVGAAPDMIRHYIELRGIGVIDVRRLFGMGSVRPTQGIDLIINLEQWKEGAQYDRLGVENLYSSILDVKIPSLTVPVRPGRNLAIIIEVAAMNNREKKMGYNAAYEFSERINRHFEEAMNHQAEPESL
ncbi:MAG: HPr(Ser) kinase/phosphatase [Oscillospiraceae bacterium]|jgi:HPr kinase/phosphorylase|nr:HPr(Ser) kinase/phosphatase [Oscillospiraceae bacterium]